MGFPAWLVEEKQRFDHWLMHGVHPDDHSRFSSDDLSDGARMQLLALLEAYFRAGFVDPGLGILRDGEWRALEKIKAQVKGGE